MVRSVALVCKRGLVCVWPYFAALIVASLALYWAMVNSAFALGSEHLRDYSATYLYVSLLQGVSVQIPGNEGFKFPLTWILFQVAICVLCVVYPGNPLEKAGLQMSIRYGSRKLLWINQMIWDLVVVFFVYAILYFCAATIALLNGLEIMGLERIASLSKIDPGAVFLYALFFPALASFGIASFQSAITFFANESAGIVFSIIYLATTTTTDSFLVIGNLAMLIRGPISFLQPYSVYKVWTNSVFAALWTLAWFSIGLKISKLKESL